MDRSSSAHTDVFVDIEDIKSLPKNEKLAQFLEERKIDYYDLLFNLKKKGIVTI